MCNYQVILEHYVSCYHILYLLCDCVQCEVQEGRVCEQLHV
jgi:hypothetical protein